MQRINLEVTDRTFELFQELCNRDADLTPSGVLAAIIKQAYQRKNPTEGQMFF